MPLHELVHDGPGALRYPTLVLRTTRLILANRPAVVVAQCPSLVLGAWLGVLRRVARFRLAADLHNEAVEPCVYTSRPYLSLIRFIHRAADVSVVSNEGLASVVAANGGRPIVLPDRIPELRPVASTRRRNGRREILFVCTFAADEPWEAVLESCRSLPCDVVVHVTGRPPAGLIETASLPPTVHFTGFLPDEEYDGLLQTVDAILDLTTIDNCLVCGAYEAVAAGAPLVTSDTTALRAHFTQGTVYTRHAPRDIAGSLETALAEAPRLRAEMVALRSRLREEWPAALERFTRTAGIRGPV